MGYMDRALKSRDPRYARILSKLGYDRRDMVAQEPQQSEPVNDDLSILRDEYHQVVGKRPFMGWDSEKLREKIAEARGGE